MPHFAENMAPLYALLRKDVRWKWTDVEEKAFNIMKDKISEQTILQHYSLHNKLILQTDASPIGIGAFYFNQQKMVSCFQFHTLQEFYNLQSEIIHNWTGKHLQ